MQVSFKVHAASLAAPPVLRSASMPYLARPDADLYYEVMADTARAFRHGVPPPGRQEELLARGIHPAAGERMAREQPALHHLYWGINNLAGDLDKQAVARSLFAAQTVTAEEVSALTVPVLGIAGLEDRSNSSAASETFVYERTPNRRARGTAVYKRPSPPPLRCER